MTRRQHQAIALVFDLRPHQPRRIDDRMADADLVDLLRLGHRRLVTDLGDLALDERVHQRRLADVGDAHDHHAQLLDIVVTMRRKALAQAGQARDLAGILARDCHRLHAALLVVVREPGLGNHRIGQIGLVQYLEARALPVQAQLAHHRVGTCLGQARVDHLDDDVDRRHRLGRLLARRGHVAGKPLNCHEKTALVKRRPLSHLFAGARSLPLK